MALIRCPECNKEVSDQASSCPNCGYSIKARMKKTKMLSPSEIAKRRRRNAWIILSCLLAVAAIITAIAVSNTKSHVDESNDAMRNAVDDYLNDTLGEGWRERLGFE
ncbi:MAG: zinc ribbon domain-containing protein [Bacillota bacterium]